MPNPSGMDSRDGQCIHFRRLNVLGDLIKSAFKARGTDRWMSWKKSEEVSTQTAADTLKSSAIAANCSSAHQ